MKTVHERARSHSGWICKNGYINRRVKTGEATICAATYLKFTAAVHETALVCERDQWRAEKRVLCNRETQNAPEVSRESMCFYFDKKDINLTLSASYQLLDQFSWEKLVHFLWRK